VFVTISLFTPCLIFAGKINSLYLESSPISVSTQVGSCLASIYSTRVEVTDTENGLAYHETKLITTAKCFIVMRQSCSVEIFKENFKISR
jgi:hypothetical protein